MAVLIDDPRAHPTPTAAQVQNWNKEQEESIKAQLAVIEAKAVKESAMAGRAMSEEALQKRRLREEKRLASAAKAAEVASASDAPSALFIPEAPKVIPEASQPGLPTAVQPDANSASIPHTIVIPAPSSTYEWYDPSAATYTTIAAAKEAGVWDYPSTLEERAKCGVFRSLWEQGYFMGGGIKFGGDYLVYPGLFSSFSAWSVH